MIQIARLSIETGRREEIDFIPKDNIRRIKASKSNKEDEWEIVIFLKEGSNIYLHWGLYDANLLGVMRTINYYLYALSGGNSARLSFICRGENIQDVSACTDGKLPNVEDLEEI